MPQRGAHNLACGEQGSQHIESTAALGFDQVPLPFGCPGAAIGVNLREPSLIKVCQGELSSGGLRAQGVDGNLS